MASERQTRHKHRVIFRCVSASLRPLVVNPIVLALRDARSMQDIRAFGGQNCFKQATACKMIVSSVESSSRSGFNRSRVAQTPMKTGFAAPN